MKATGMDTRGRQMLELLSEGASARVVARKLGYSEGTTRVYLHHLYKTIGVRNKTEAVIWYLNRTRAQEARPAPTLPAPGQTQPANAIDGLAGLSLGDLALNEDVYTALGIMGSFLGPYGHVWEAGLRLKGEAIDEKMVARRAQSRLLWRALLKGDFAYAKLLHDEGIGERLLQDSPSDAWLLAALLLLGGYSSASERLMTPLLLKRKGSAGITAREGTLLRALSEALDGREAGLAALHEIAAESGRNPIVKQVAMAALFHAYRARRDADRARATAKAIWAEAESARQQLEAMGVRPLAREHALPRPARAGAKEAPQSREKAAVTR